MKGLFIPRRGVVGVAVVGCLMALALPGAASADCVPSPSSFCMPTVVPFNGPNGPSSPSSPSVQQPKPQPQAQSPQTVSQPAQAASPQMASSIDPVCKNAVSGPGLQARATVSGSAAVITVDPPTAPVGATITVTASGLGPNRCATVNLAQMKDIYGIAQLPKQLLNPDGSPADPVTGSDGSLSAQLVLPEIWHDTAPSASICIRDATVTTVCTPFTIAAPGGAPVAPGGSVDAPAINTATTPADIVGQYMCSSALLVDFGSMDCSMSFFAPMALNPDGSYAWGDEQGTWRFDGSTVSFDGGSLSTGTIMNRNLTIKTDQTMNDGSTVTMRIVYNRVSN